MLTRDSEPPRPGSTASGNCGRCPGPDRTGAVPAMVAGTGAARGRPGHFNLKSNFRRRTVTASEPPGPSESDKY